MTYPNTDTDLENYSALLAASSGLRMKITRRCPNDVQKVKKTTNKSNNKKSTTAI
jgi:hypothetical protein